MSVVPPENTDRLEHEKQQHEAATHHHTTEHREHIPPATDADEKALPTDAVSPASGESSEPSSESPDYQTKTVWTFKTFVATVALSGHYVGSQIPV